MARVYKEKTLTTKDGEREFLVDYRYESNEEKKNLIIFFHGFKGFKDWGHFNLLADYLAGQGFAVVKFNAAYNGTTSEQPHAFADLEAFGNNTISKELDDLDVVIDESLAGNLVPPDEINFDGVFLMGHSRGGGVSIIKTATDVRVKGLVTLAAPAKFDISLTKQMEKDWEATGVTHILNSRTNQQMPLRKSLADDIKRYKWIPANFAEQIKVPSLLIHGTHDETVPMEHAILMSNSNPLIDRYLIESANHVFGGSHPYKGTELPAHTINLLEKTVYFFRNL